MSNDKTVEDDIRDILNYCVQRYEGNLYKMFSSLIAERRRADDNEKLCKEKHDFMLSEFKKKDERIERLQARLQEAESENNRIKNMELCGKARCLENVSRIKTIESKLHAQDELIGRLRQWMMVIKEVPECADLDSDPLGQINEMCNNAECAIKDLDKDLFT